MEDLYCLIGYKSESCDYNRDSRQGSSFIFENFITEKKLIDILVASKFSYETREQGWIAPMKFIIMQNGIKVHDEIEGTGYDESLKYDYNDYYYIEVEVEKNSKKSNENIHRITNTVDMKVSELIRSKNMKEELARKLQVLKAQQDEEVKERAKFEELKKKFG